MAELAHGVAGDLSEKLGSVAQEGGFLSFGMKNDMKKLGETTLMLRSVLHDAEKKQAKNEPLQMWLVRVNDAFKDAVDVLDEFECEALRGKVVKEFGGVGQKIRRFFSRANPIAFRFSIAPEVKEIRKRFDEIARGVAQFHLISSPLSVDDQKSDQIDLTTRSFVKASRIFGRDGDKARIIDVLLGINSNHDGLAVISIVGIGGLGKTTIAKSVYDDDKVTPKFDLKIWVSASSDFDVTHLAREILREIDEEEDPSKMSIEELQTSLLRSLRGKRFLLVLDDVQNEDRDKWLELREFLAGGDKGSKVIVTTRSTLVSSIMTTTPPYHLHGLSLRDSRSLFFTCAFGDEIDAELYPRRKEIGKTIVRRCGGIPLALKILGCLLYLKTEAEWIRVRDHELWESEEEGSFVSTALRLSYNAMSPCLRQCFAYCSTFAAHRPMKTIELISIWMALGIIRSTHGNTELEDIGNLQRKELQARSFFQYEDSDDEEVSEFLDCRFFVEFKMHNLVRALSGSVTSYENFFTSSSEEVVPDSVRYLRMSLNKEGSTFPRRLKKLWSLHVDETSEYDATESFISTCIEQSRYLRVFGLQKTSFEELPSSISSLKHLRYLNLSKNKMIKRLPDSICELQSLQTLLLFGCDELEELPRGIRKLISLRTLSVTTKQINFHENEIGRLKALRTLIVGRCINLKYLPRDLKYCTTLRTLVAFKCDELDIAREFDETVIELNLQKLYIHELPKTTALPQWLKGASRTLKLLLIAECGNFIELPEWLPEVVSLKALFIAECKELVALPDGIQHLESLSHMGIGDCERLDLGNGLENIVTLALEVMSFGSLPETTALPRWLHGASKTLKCLEIQDCPKLAKLPEWLPSFSSLERLRIEECGELSVLPKGIQRLTSLTSLEIENCEQLELASESEEVVQLSLRSFEIRALPETTALPEWLQGASHTLKTLHIEDCPKMASLPEWLTAFTSIENLVIKSCPELSSLPEGMSSLTSLACLDIISPSSTFYERYRFEIGIDWSTISHIPNIFLDTEEYRVIPATKLSTNLS